MSIGHVPTVVRARNTDLRGMLDGRNGRKLPAAGALLKFGEPGAEVLGRCRREARRG